MKFPGVLPIMAFTERLRPKGATLFELQVYETGAPNEKIVQNHLNIALLNVF